MAERNIDEKDIEEKIISEKVKEQAFIENAHKVIDTKPGIGEYNRSKLDDLSKWRKFKETGMRQNI